MLWIGAAPATGNKGMSTMSFPVKIGVVGCGNISVTYLRNLPLFKETEVVACGDLVPERALAQAIECGIGRVHTLDEILADPDIEIVLNLTTPVAHSGIALAALHAGKHVYNEKPLAIERADGQRLLQTAAEKGLRVGCAPDTFLGAGQQTARKLLDAGTVGEPVAGAAFMTCHGHEGWHPDPEFYYQRGGGPLMDMGPYYLTSLVNLLGPVRRVCASARISFAQRKITSEPKAGKLIDVDVPTHVAGVLDFAGGAVVTLMTSFDVWHAELPRLEIYGAEGTLSVPDPNGFGGPVRVRKAHDESWHDVAHAFEYTDESRGIGLADLAHALRTGRPHRAAGELALHVLDVIHALLESSEQGRHVELETTCVRPAPLPTGLPAGILDD